MQRNLNIGPVSATKYLKSGRARKLPLHNCYMPSTWEEMGKFPVLISRKHTNGNITAAILLVDILCTGVKDAFFLFNEPEEEFQTLVDKYNIAVEEMRVYDYNLVHNVVFGSLEFAEGFGIKPYKEWPLVSMILEKDDEHIPLMEIPMGEDGRPLFLFSPDDPKASYYLKQLKAHAGEGNFEVINEEDFLYGEEDEFEEDEDWDIVKDFDAWGPKDWQEFLSEIDIENISPFNPIINHMYEKLRYEPLLMAGEFDLLELPKYMKIEDRPRPVEVVLPTEDLEQSFNLYKSLDEDQDPEQLELIIEQIKDAIKRWPEQPRLYYLLATAYSFNGAIRKAEAVNREALKKFPNHFHQKLMQAELMVRQEKPEEIKKIFDGLSPHEALKGRTTVNIREIVPLFTVLGHYFLQTENVPKAYHLYSMINDLDLNDQIEPDSHFEWLMLLHVTGQVNIMLKQMQRAPAEIEQAAKILARKKGEGPGEHLSIV